MGAGPVVDDGCAQAAGPAWEGVGEEVLCPLCDYNLRGLGEARCPECGYRFEWGALLDPRRRKHPYLFEHHPEANARSFWRTLNGARRPRQFWASLHPYQPSKPQRMLLYWCIGAAVFLCVSMCSEFVLGARWYSMAMAPFGAQSGRSFGKYFQNYIDAIQSHHSVAVWTSSGYSQIPIGPLAGILDSSAPIVWHGLTLLTILIFQQTVRRARLRTVHLARCIVYSGDPAWWARFVLAMLAVNLLRLWLSVDPVWNGLLQVWGGIDPFEWLNSLIWIVVAVLTLRRLHAALRYYLQIDRPLLTMLASQAIVGLVVADVYYVRHFGW